MTEKATGQSNDRQFCWEQVGKSNRLFRISRVFAPRQCTEKLLPLYALFSAVEQICSSISDDDVARSKLNWWRNECLQNVATKSRHPVMKELSRTGAINDLRRESVAELLDGAESRLYTSAPPDLEALKGMCIELHRPQLELELGVSGLKGSMLEFEPGLLARNGTLQLIRESVYRKEQGGFWWVPLNLLARHGVSREDIVTDPRSPAVRDLLAEVLMAAESWGRESDEISGSGTVDFSPARHLFAINGLYSRKLKRLKGITPDLFAGELGRVVPADLFKAWNCARRLNHHAGHRG
jgi:phytoene synthase